jgi:hypothetical protein
MEKQKKIYCGSGKKKSENWLQISINPEKFGQYIKEYNGSKYLRLNINLLSEPDKYGKDVSVSIDTWEPNKTGETKQWTAPSTAVPAKYEDDGGLPF